MSVPQPLSLETVISAVAMNADSTGTTVNLKECRSYAVQAVWSAGSTPVGTFYVRGSLDNSTFTDIASQAVSGNSGSFLLNVEMPAYNYMQTFYDNTSGNGTLTVKAALKR